MRAIKYFFDEALASLRRGYKTGVVATLTITTAFVVLGGFLLLTSNLERLFARWQEAAEFSAYFTDAVTADQRANVESLLRKSGAVRAIEFVSKEQALTRFKQNFGTLSDATHGLPENPLPASIEVRLAQNANPATVESLAQSTATLAGVADVRYDRRWIQRLLNAVGMIRAGGFALATMLVLAAALTVASVVRLALLARREEIHIMQLVGAPLAYIRGPFVMEGLIQGGVGAIVAVTILWILFALLRARAGTLLAGAVDPAALVFLSVPAVLFLLLAGMAIGSLGGFLAAWITREVAE